MSKGLALALLALAIVTLTAADPPSFEPVQPDIFAAPGALVNAWADVDNDGDLDLFVGFSFNKPNRFYRNDDGHFTDIAGAAGIADLAEVRGAGWGDFDSDGFVDLYVGLSGPAGTANRLYRNIRGTRFEDVADAFGVALATPGVRQVSWVDVDGDGDLDLFVGYRGSANRLLRNDGARFADVGAAFGLDDPRRTVGASWFDFDEDGDLDLFVANQDGDANGVFRNDRTRFVDIAKALGMDAADRGPMRGSVGTCVGDYDGDGRLDLFSANYGPSSLWHNLGGGRFEDVASAQGLAVDQHNDSCAWGDVDHDGRPDLYVSAFLATTWHYRDYLYHNDGSRFTDVMPKIIADHDADHGVQWADFDRDGDLDLALADSNAQGNHYLFRNLLTKDAAARSVQVMVVDRADHYTRAGSEVRVYAAGTRRLLGSGLVDTGSGYDSQSATPVHVGLPTSGSVDVEVTSLRGGTRVVTREPNIVPADHVGRAIVIRVP